MADDTNDPEGAIRSARERQHELADTVESILEDVRTDFGEHTYPVRREELAAEYADEEFELVNETETLGDVFDRLVHEKFDSPEEVREAVFNELTGEVRDSEEYNDERALREIERVEEEYERSEEEL